MKLKVVKVRSTELGNFVCPWCASKFVTRKLLLEHFVESAACARNRDVSNGTNSKHLMADMERVTPGEPTLDEVEAKRRRGEMRNLNEVHD